MEVLKKIWSWFGKKLVVVVAGLGLEWLRARHPDWSLPDKEFSRDLIVAFLGAHTLTDVVALVKGAKKDIWENVGLKLLPFLMPVLVKVFEKCGVKVDEAQLKAMVEKALSDWTNASKALDNK